MISKIEIAKKRTLALTKSYFPNSEVEVEEEDEDEDEDVNFNIKIGPKTKFSLKVDEDNFIYLDIEFIEKSENISGSEILKRIENICTEINKSYTMINYISMSDLSSVSLYNDSGFEYIFPLDTLKLMSTGKSWYNSKGYFQDNYNEKLFDDENNKNCLDVLREISLNKYIISDEVIVYKFKNILSSMYDIDLINKYSNSDIIGAVFELIEDKWDQSKTSDSILEVGKQISKDIKGILTDDQKFNMCLIVNLLNRYYSYDTNLKKNFEIKTYSFEDAELEVKNQFKDDIKFYYDNNGCDLDGESLLLDGYYNYVLVFYGVRLGMLNSSLTYEQLKLFNNVGMYINLNHYINKDTYCLSSIPLNNNELSTTLGTGKVLGFLGASTYEAKKGTGYIVSVVDNKKGEDNQLFADVVYGIERKKIKEFYNEKVAIMNYIFKNIDESIDITYKIFKK